MNRMAYFSAAAILLAAAFSLESQQQAWAAAEPPVCPDDETLIFSDGLGDPPKCAYTNGGYFEWTSRSSSTCGTWQYFPINIPPNAHSLLVASWDGAGEGEGWADLYLKYGSKPTATEFDYGSANTGSNEETLLASDPLPGTWWIGMRSNCMYSGVTLAATWNTAR